jgi:energy-coupling factor transporter ATP-binding protein EcfA2
MFVQEVSGNLKGGVKAQLSPKTLILGPSGSGKTAIVNALELALTSQVSDLRFRELAASDQLISELGTKGEPLSVLLKFDTGAQASYGVPKGKLKGQANRPHTIDPDRVMPMRRVLAALRGDADTTRKFLLSYIVGSLTVGDLQIPEALQPSWRSVIAGHQRDEPLVDVVAAAIDAAGTHERQASSRITETTLAVEQTAAELQARPTEGEWEAAKRRHTTAQSEVARIQSTIQNISAHQVLKNRRDQAANELVEVKSALEHLRSEFARLQAAWKAAVGQGGLKQTLEVLQQVVGRTLTNAQVTHIDAAGTLSCPVCRQGATIERMTQIHAALGAELTKLAGQPDAAALLGELHAVKARGDYLTERERNLGAELERMNSELAAQSFVNGDGLYQELQGAIKEGEVAYEALQAITLLRGRWETLAKQRESIGVLEKNKEAWHTLAEHLTAKVAELVDARASAFEAKVQARLPSNLTFRLKLKDGKRNVCHMGLESEGGLRTALSGYEQAVVLAAIADACAGDQPYHLITVPDRQMDSKSLAAALLAMKDMAGQVVVTSTVEPTVVPPGWTVVKTGDVGKTTYWAGAPVDGLKPMKADDWEADDWEYAEPDKGKFVERGAGMKILTDADMAANAKLQEEEEARRKAEFEANVQEAGAKLKKELKPGRGKKKVVDEAVEAQSKVGPDTAPKPKRKYTRKPKSEG